MLNMASASSTPSSEVRRSTSSQPSPGSSATLHSRRSALNLDPGESSVSKRRKSPLRSILSEDRNEESHANGRARGQGLLGSDLAPNQERTRRKRSPRRSGGFLLEPLLPGVDSLRRKKDKDKLHIEKRRKSKSPGSYESSPGHYSRSSSPRSFPSSSGDPSTLSPDVSQEIHAPGDSRQGTARESKGLGVNFDLPNDGPEQQSSSSGIDPFQIVNMALSLNESRRRQFSAGQLPPPAIGSGRRTTSAGYSMQSTPMQGSFTNYSMGGSLKQALQQQPRRISRNMSPNGGRIGTPPSRHVSVSTPGSVMDPSTGIQHTYTFSDATLARAAKARIYIELGCEYRRLLQFLPPLSPAEATSASLSASSIPGTAIVDLKPTSLRSTPQLLGRRYNPLQFIRNRKLRARERHALNPDYHEFEDSDRVREWIDEVEEASQENGYRRAENVQLPPFEPRTSIATLPQQSSGESKKSSILSGKAPRPRMDWFTLPSEFLADAVWMEQDSHKALIEDRHGNRIFPEPRVSLQKSRISRDFARTSLDRQSSAGHVSDYRTTDTSDNGSTRGRKKRHFLHRDRDDSQDRGRKLGWIRSRSNSSSGLSSSDDDRDVRRRAAWRRPSQAENIGPLERHLQSMIENEAKQESHSSPNFSSPDRWGTGQAARRVRTDPEHPEQHGEKTAAQQATTRLKSAAENPPMEQRQSFESSAPLTPLSQTFSLDRTSSPSGLASPDHKPHRRSKLPFFRSDAVAAKHKSIPSDILSESTHSRHISGEPVDQGHLSVEQLHRSNSKPLLKTHNTTESIHSISSFELKDGKRREPKDKEPGSAVTRFFKGVRQEGSKVGHFVFKKDKPPEDSDSSSDGEHSSTSDSDDDMSRTVVLGRPKPVSRTATDTGAMSDASDSRSKYHMELPTFKSANAQPQGEKSDPEDGKLHVHRRRPTRFDRLAPPRLDLGKISSRSSSPGDIPEETREKFLRAHSVDPEIRSRSPSAARNHINALLELPGGVGRTGHLPPTGLSVNTVDSASTARPPIGHRQWSISNHTLDNQRRPSGNLPKASFFTTRTEIARVRALLLCSGIKAAELARRAHEVHDPPSRFLIKAAAVAENARVYPLPASEEHVLAARFLSSNLACNNEALLAATDSFARFRAAELRRRCEALQIEIGDKLTPRCHNCADDADAFLREVGSEATLAVKAIVDRIEAMGRARRRRFRWVRRAGWVMLEWMVLGIMWWVWLVVVVVRGVLGVGRCAGRGVKWLLWME
ncbi:uncharacterized protein BKA78DRAFT_309378 [Phyllosticta capitalensis]|uniref:uncharacterized protein n=1 Tax=Phyllosticta capitalensis TaxID=121624 RepID=UPI00312E8D77